MTTTPTTPPAAAPPGADPAFTGLQAKVYQCVGDAAVILGCAPHSVTVSRDDAGARHASMTFDSIQQAGAWADWLHWAFAVNSRDGKLTLQGFGQWLGFSWLLIGREPLVPMPIEG